MPLIIVNTVKHYILKINIMQADEKQYLKEKQKILIKTISNVIKELVKGSGKSGRKISEEYDIGLGVISKIERNMTSDIKISTIWKFINIFEITPEQFFKMVKNELPADFNFYE